MLIVYNPHIILTAWLTHQTFLGHAGNQHSNTLSLRSLQYTRCLLKIISNRKVPFINHLCLFTNYLEWKNKPETSITSPSKSNKYQTQTCYILSNCEFILAPRAPFPAQLAQSSPKDGVPGAHNKPPISQRKTQKFNRPPIISKRLTRRFFLIMSVRFISPFLEGISPSLKIY